MSVHIGYCLYQRIVASAIAGAPQEVCGLLLGTHDRGRAVISDMVASRNVAANPQASFEIEPALVLEVPRTNGRNGAHLIGFYHSHPNGSARPSASDLDNAWPNFFYLIVAVNHNTDSSIWHVPKTGTAQVSHGLIVEPPPIDSNFARAYDRADTESGISATGDRHHGQPI
ncbi:MAG: M67 family metallopeptidase [Planctomycetes bacterium]|nr:M67 family metallopeptidase [Planctomycetota bacterium]